MDYACRSLQCYFSDPSSLLGISTMSLLDVFFPKRCLGCGKFGQYFCLACQKNIRVVALNDRICPVCQKSAIDGATHPRCKTKYSLDGLVSFFHYDGIVRDAVKSLKYRFVSTVASEFVLLVPARLYKDIPFPLLKDAAWIVPIPLHPSRLRTRGFNQAAILASFVAQRLNISQPHDILKRVKKTVPQADLPRKGDRLKNMEHVFVLGALPVDTHIPILLFDDVFTTGATMQSAASVLKRAGYRCVWAVTMAR
jgi:ComF family protein